MRDVGAARVSREEAHAQAMKRLRAMDTTGLAQAFSVSNGRALLDMLDCAAARELRLAQALRLLRDTSGEYVGNVAQRALDEAGIPEPPDEDHP